MSEDNKNSPTGSESTKPASKTTTRKRASKPAATKTAASAAKKSSGSAAAKKAAPKKTGASGTKTSANKAPTARKAAAKKTTPKKEGASATVADTPEATAAAAASAPQHGDVLREAAQETSPASEPEASAPPERDTEEPATSSDARHQYRDDDPYSAENLKSEFAAKDWGAVATRAAFTVFYLFASWVAVVLGGGLSVIQFLIFLVNGEGNDVIRRAIVSIGRYIGDVAAYFSFSSNERPFPFGKDLPDGE